MIKASELRVGNMVHGIDTFATTHSDFIVRKLDEKGVNGEEMNARLIKYARDVTGIPLTPEILVKYGFENRGGWIGLFLNVPVWDEETEFVLEFMEACLTAYADDVRIKVIENPTLHQLQNLFYALIGEELKEKI